MEWVLGTIALIAVAIWAGRHLDRPPRQDSIPDPDAATAAPVVVEFGDEIDLHGIPGRDVDPLVDEFVHSARARGRRCVTIIHGRGSGILRRRVRARLARNPGVERFADASGRARGATAVWLAPLAADSGAD